MTCEGQSALGNQELLPCIAFMVTVHIFIFFSYSVTVQVSGAFVRHEVSQTERQSQW